MKKFCKSLLLVTVAVIVTLLTSSCFRQDYLMFEDGDFDGMEFSDYDLMQNAELDMDDMDRNWHDLCQHLFAFFLKIIKRHDAL